MNYIVIVEKPAQDQFEQIKKSGDKSSLKN